MSRGFQQFLITEAQADHLSAAIEDSIEDAHGVTLEYKPTDDDYISAVDHAKALKAVLEQIDPENPIFSADAKAGVKFDWEEFWDTVESGDEDDEDDDDLPDDDEEIVALASDEGAKATG